MEIHFEGSCRTLVVPASKVGIQGDEAWVPVKGGHNVCHLISATPSRITVGPFIRFERKYQ